MIDVSDGAFIGWMQDFVISCAQVMTWLQTSFDKLINGLFKQNLIYLIIFLGAFGYAAFAVVGFFQSVSVQRGNYRSEFAPKGVNVFSGFGMMKGGSLIGFLRRKKGKKGSSGSGGGLSETNDFVTIGGVKYERATENKGRSRRRGKPLFQRNYIENHNYYGNEGQTVGYTSDSDTSLSSRNRSRSRSRNPSRQQQQEELKRIFELRESWFSSRSSSSDFVDSGYVDPEMEGFNAEMEMIRDRPVSSERKKVNIDIEKDDDD